MIEPSNECQIETREDAVVVRVVGVVDLASAPALRGDLQRAAEQAYRDDVALVLSLEHCDYLDSTAFKALAAFQRECRLALHVVVPPTHRVRELFDLLGYGDAFAFAPSVEAVTQAAAAP